MPLSDHGGFVSRFTHEDGQRLFVRGDISPKIKYSVAMIVETGNDIRSGRRTDRIGAERVFKDEPLFRQFIYGGRWI